MQFKGPRRQDEKRGSDKLRAFLQQRGWNVEKTHGSQYQSGWPDLYAMHPNYGERWIETKTDSGRIRNSQRIKFTKWRRFGVKVWILRDEKDYEWLFGEPNWWRWLDKDYKP